jgi:hypothetical protein
MNVKTFILLVKGMRHSAVAFVAACDGFIDHLEQQVERQQEADSAPPATNNPCPHPGKFRKSAGTMGAANRFYCELCEQTINPDEPKEQ